MENFSVTGEANAVGGWIEPETPTDKGEITVNIFHACSKPVLCLGLPPHDKRLVLGQKDRYGFALSHRAPAPQLPGVYKQFPASIASMRLSSGFCLALREACEPKAWGSLRAPSRLPFGPLAFAGSTYTRFFLAGERQPHRAESWVRVQRFKKGSGRGVDRPREVTSQQPPCLRRVLVCEQARGRGRHARFSPGLTAVPLQCAWIRGAQGEIRPENTKWAHRLLVTKSLVYRGRLE